MATTAPTPCGFEPYGRTCPNTATVVVTLRPIPGCLDEEVPTCPTCLPDWNDDVQATARPIGATS